MTSLDVRSNSAVMKRAEQLKRWEESETNREPPTPRPEHGRKIKFSSGCVFLAACLAGDKEEVVKLIEQGADINTANVDGLTALHQACIDDNLEMVEFLVENGADINRQDNEGWTPLHATASCGFVSIARYLVEQGADVAAVNSDGDLAFDLAADIQHVPMIDFMQKTVEEHKIDCEKARKAEEQLMLADAKRWLRSDASEVDRPHPKTGATPLHVAAAKGYTKVLSLLLAGRANVDKQDNDGWTPLHAAAHWGQKEAAEMLVDAMADMEVRNYAGQSCIDVSDRKTVKFLEELRANNKRIKRRPSSQIRISDTIENHIENTPTKIIRVEVKPDQTKELSNETETETDSDVTDSTESSHSSSILDVEDEKLRSAADANKPQSTSETTNEDEAPWRRNSAARARNANNEIPTKNQVPEKEASKLNATETSDVILRRTQSFENDEKFYQKYNELRARIKANSCPTLPAPQNSNNNNNNNNNSNNNSNNNNNNSNSNSNRNSNSHNNCITNNTTTPSANTNTPSTNQNYLVQRSASLKDHRNFRATTLPPIAPAVTPATASTAPSTTATTTTTTPIRRSFVPPTRDEESETQRKLHAKRVRETRRSTQGVTLEEIKSAEELVKKKNSAMNNNNNSSSFKLEDASSGINFPQNNSTIIPSAPAVIAAANLSTTSTQRRNPTVTSSNQSLNSIGRPVSASAVADSNIISKNILDKPSSERISDISSYTSRRLNPVTTSSATTATTATAGTNNSYTIGTAATTVNKNAEEKDNDKENDNRTTVATNAVIQRRRKPKRRSTGVVHLDGVMQMDDLDQERADAANDTDEKEKEKERDKERVESGSERTSRSRLGSNASISATDDKKSRDKSESGDGIDYKALWEAAKLENDKLKQQLKKKDEEAVQTRATLERITNATTKNSLSEIEKRERRAMERKFSEMEEELKQLEVYKTENLRLKEENGALIRVISKLTTLQAFTSSKTTKNA